MKDKTKELWEKVKEPYLKLSKKVRMILLIAVLALVALGVGMILVNTLRPYTVLFSDLTSEDSQAIISYLEENGVTNYRLENGNTITVPSNMEPRLKANILLQGYPKSGFGYETYRSAVGTMSTESDRNIAFLQDLQDRMAAVVRYMDGVQDAVVTITQAEDRRYVLDSSNVTKASASVFVDMKGGATLTEQQAAGIRTLISRSVKGLEIDGNNIGIVDSQGNTYGASGTSGSSLDASALKLQLEQQVNFNIRNQIIQLLTPLYGTDNFRVAVNSTVDVSHSVGESTTYTEPEWAADGSTGGKGIIGSQVFTQELTRGGNGQNAGGAAGTTTNSDINTYMNNNLQTNGNETYIRNEGTTDYNVNTNKEQTERWAGTVTDVMVAVTINSEVAGGTNEGNLTTHIGRAAGITPDIQADKISLYLSPFVNETPEGFLPNVNSLPFPPWVLYAAAGGLLLLIILLALILGLRKKRKRKLSEELGALLDSQMLPNAEHVEPSGVDIMTIKSERSMELRKTIRQFAEENPEIAAYMLKTWLRGEDEQHA